MLPGNDEAGTTDAHVAPARVETFCSRRRQRRGRHLAPARCVRTGSAVDRSHNYGRLWGLVSTGMPEPFLHLDWCGGLQRYPGPNPGTCGCDCIWKRDSADATKIRVLRWGDCPGFAEKREAQEVWRWLRRDVSREAGGGKVVDGGPPPGPKQGREPGSALGLQRERPCRHPDRSAVKPALDFGHQTVRE